MDELGFGEAQALTQAAKAMQLGSAADGSHRLRQIWNESIEAGTNQTVAVYTKVDSEAAERKVKLQTSRAVDGRVKVPRSFYPSIISVAAEWAKLAIRMTGPRLQHWLEDAGYKVHANAARNLINDVLRIKFGKYDKAQERLDG